MKLDREKYMVAEEVKRLLRAVKTRVRMWGGGCGPNRKKGAPHPNMLRDFAMLCLDAQTGVRVSELVGFRIADFRGVHGETRGEKPAKVRVRRAKKKDPRTGGPVYEEIAFPELAQRAIIEYLASLPPSKKEPHSRLFPLTTRQAERVFKVYARRAGLSAKLSIHSLRHSYALELYTRHRDLKLVQDALGHADISTTQIYMHTVDGDSKMAAMDIDLEEKADVG